MYLTQNLAQRLPGEYPEIAPRKNLLRLLVAEHKSSYLVPPKGCPKIPPSIQLRQYQKQAVASWFANQGRGTLKMATGSGCRLPHYLSVMTN